MQTFEKDGYVFVGDLFWPTPANNKSYNMQKLKKDTGLDLYVKVAGNNISNYGFAKKTTFNKSLKKIVSLGAFLLNFYEDDPIDIIIIVRLGENEAGLLALKNGNVIPRGGDMIGDVEQIRARVIHLIDTHGIGGIWTAGFRNYFYEDKEILSRIKGLNPHFIAPIEETDEDGNSFQSVWEYKNTKKAIKKSLLKHIPIIDIKDKKVLRIIIISFIVFIIIFMYILIKKKNEVKEFIAIKSTQIPTSIDAQKFATICFDGTNKYFGSQRGWQLDSFTCSLNARISNFSTNYATPPQLTKALNNNNILFNDNVGILKEVIKLNFINLQEKSKITVYDRIQKLQALKQISSIKVQIMMPNNFTTYSTIANNQKIKFSITSRFSLLWFIKNHYLDDIGIYNVVAKYDDNSGFYNWTISGELLN